MSLTTEAGTRGIISAIFDAAVAATRGSDLIVSRSSFDGSTWRYSDGQQTLGWEIPADGRVIVVGGGKAAASLARGLEAVLGNRITRGCIVVKHGHGEPLTRIAIYEGGHPVPDEAGVKGTEAMLRQLAGLTVNDRVFVVLTGGASALLVAPADGLTVAEKARTTSILLASGATISEINTVRKLLSRVKGGRLLDAIGPAESVTLMISDVPDDDPTMIGSGPTWPKAACAQEALALIDGYGVRDQLPASVLAHLCAPQAPSAPSRLRGHARHLILADARTALNAATAAAHAHGLAVEVVDHRMDDGTHSAARRFARTVQAVARERQAGGPATILLASGETTLKVTGSGKGGRNQEFALVCALELAGTPGVTLLASGTDGTDGPTDAAGAFADDTTIARAHAAGVDPQALLANNDSYRFFSTLGDLHLTGPTGTNVMDLVIALVA